MSVSENDGFSPQIIHFNRVFHYKPSILGYPYFWKHPNGQYNEMRPCKLCPCWLSFSQICSRKWWTFFWIPPVDFRPLMMIKNSWQDLEQILTENVHDTAMILWKGGRWCFRTTWESYPTEADVRCFDLRFEPTMKTNGENLARKTVSSSRLLVTEVEFEVDMVPSDGTFFWGGVISHL